MGQQLGESLFDIEDVPPGARMYDPDRPEIVQHIEVVEAALDNVEHAALQLRHVAFGATARAEQLFGKFTEHPMPSQRTPLAPE